MTCSGLPSNLACAAQGPGWRCRPVLIVHDGTRRIDAAERGDDVVFSTPPDAERSGSKSNRDHPRHRLMETRTPQSAREHVFRWHLRIMMHPQPAINGPVLTGFLLRPAPADADIPRGF